MLKKGAAVKIPSVRSDTVNAFKMEGCVMHLNASEKTARIIYLIHTQFVKWGQLFNNSSNPTSAQMTNIDVEFKRESIESMHHIPTIKSIANK